MVQSKGRIHLFFKRGNSIPLRLAFKAEGSIIGFQRGEGPLLVFKSGVHFQSAFIYVVKGEGGGTITLYFTENEKKLYLECLKNHNTELIIILSVGLIFVNIIIFVYGTSTGLHCLIFFKIETEVLSLTVLSMYHNNVSQRWRVHYYISKVESTFKM